MFCFFFSSRSTGKQGVAFIVINLKTKYLRTKKDKTKAMHFFSMKSHKDRPPRHAFVCVYLTGKKSSNLVVFDPMSKSFASRENKLGMWSISILNNLYYALNKPNTTFQYGSSRGSDCLWQSLRQLDRIIHDPEILRPFLASAKD